jgi:uncharacterized protein (DUF1499 family)
MAGRPRRALQWALAAVAAVVLLTVIGGQMGLFAGKRPHRIGVVNGQLQPVRTQLFNAVSSTATTSYHRIEPLPAGTDPQAGFARLREQVLATPGARIVQESPGYLYAEFSSKWLGFVDDVEFLLDAKRGVIDVRSASRLGRKDFGVNRRRIEALRARL